MATIVNLGVALNSIMPAGGGSVLPISDAKGWLFKVNKAENKSTASGQSGKLSFEVEIIQEGEANGSTSHYEFNVYNQNPEARRISLEQLSAFALVCGLNIADPQFDADMFIGRQFRGVVVDAPWTNNNGETIKGSKIKTVYGINGEKARDMVGKVAPVAANVPSFATVATSATTAAQQVTQAQPTAQAAPWLQAQPAQVPAKAPWMQ